MSKSQEKCGCYGALDGWHTPDCKNNDGVYEKNNREKICTNCNDKPTDNKDTGGV